MAQRLICHYDLFCQTVRLKKANSKYSSVSLQRREHCVKPYVHLFITSDINSPLKHCCAVHNIFILLAVKCSSRTRTECIVVFQRNSGQAMPVLFMFCDMIGTLLGFLFTRKANLHIPCCAPAMHLPIP